MGYPEKSFGSVIQYLYYQISAPSHKKKIVTWRKHADKDSVFKGVTGNEMGCKMRGECIEYD